MGKEELQATFQLIEDALSSFQYHDQVSVKQQMKTPPNKMELIYHFNQQEFNLSDLYIVQCIADLRFGTMEQICSYIKFYTKKNSIKGKMTDNDDALKSRIQTLCDLGLLYRFRYKPYKNVLLNLDRNSSFYLVSPHGYNFIKKQLYYDKPYDEFLAISPIEDVFKYLSANTFIHYLTTNNGLELVDNNVLFKKKSTKKRYELVSTAHLAVGEKKYKLIVEPIKFYFNTQRIDKDKLKQMILERVGIMKDILSNVEVEEEETYVLFLTEDIKGLKAMESIIKGHLSDFIPYIYISTDAAIFLGKDKAFLRLENREDGMKYVPTTPFFCGK